jgi:hypothetical protein
MTKAFDHWWETEGKKKPGSSREDLRAAFEAGRKSALGQVVLDRAGTIGRMDRHRKAL